MKPLAVLATAAAVAAKATELKAVVANFATFAIVQTVFFAPNTQDRLQTDYMSQETAAVAA